MITVIIVIIHHLMLNLLGIELHRFFMYGIPIYLITRVTSLKN
jgi:hypothetical protein